MHDTEAIRHAHPIAETVIASGVALRRRGRRLVGRCPFHRDREPSLSVYPETASWFCYGCDAGGDVIDFVARLRGRGFKETVSALGEHAPPLPANVTRLPARHTRPVLGGDELAAIEAAVAHYEHILMVYRDARAYITGRGISLETARSLRLGYAAGGLAEHLRRTGRSIAVAERLGLLRQERDVFRGRVVIPDLDGEGRATWFTGRTLTSGRPRYLGIAAPVPLLGLAQARASGSEAVTVVEGPLDRLTACEWGIPAVALLGTHASATALRALSGFRRVYLALDADPPGRRAAQVLAAKLGNRASIVALPPGAQDLNELGQVEGGRDAFLRALATARARKGEEWQPSDRAARVRAA